MRRNLRERMILGVVAGLADYHGVDVAVMRLLAVVLLFASFGTALIAYLIAAVIMPAG